jgi:hypothetical protein
VLWAASVLALRVSLPTARCTSPCQPPSLALLQAVAATVRASSELLRTAREPTWMRAPAARWGWRWQSSSGAL